MTEESKKEELIEPPGYPIRARSHLLRLLGDELIGDDGLAVFELVKNGYDADANEVSVTLNLNHDSEPNIIVSDNGHGMSLSDITGKWLELATNSKREDREKRSDKYHRLALGEKGIGRIAALKLGSQITLTTRSINNPEYQLSLNWDSISGETDYLEDIAVDVKKNDPPKRFPDEEVGAHIKISGLRRKNWSRAEIRKLYRLVTSLTSPFDMPDYFKVKFSIPGRESELNGLLPGDGFLDNAVWTYHFEIGKKETEETEEKANYKWSYKFTPPQWNQVKERTLSEEKDALLLLEFDDESKDDKKSKKKREKTGEEKKEEGNLFLTSNQLKGIGPIKGAIYAYYRRSEVLKTTKNLSLIKMWLDDHTGVRIYREGVRVFNYGEPGDDWLGLNARRINRPSGKLGTNSIVSAIHLKLPESEGLKEKTNREGFDNSSTYAQFHQIISSVFEHFHAIHAPDREALDNVIRGTGVKDKALRFQDAMESLRRGIKKKKIDKEYATELAAIEDEFIRMRDVMVSAGSAGLNLAVIFHEVEREIDALAAAIEGGITQALLKKQIDHIYQLLHGFAPLLKKNKAKLLFASDVINSATRIRQARCRFHNVALSIPILVQEEADFRIRGQSSLLTNCLGNLVDNSMYWARVRRDKDREEVQPAILITTSSDPESGSGMIAVVDNGPGFSSEMREGRALQAFTTTRPGGMGLGMYFAGLVMEQCGGELTVHSAEEVRDEIDIPDAFDGAAVVMRFMKGK